MIKVIIGDEGHDREESGNKITYTGLVLGNVY